MEKCILGLILLSFAGTIAWADEMKVTPATVPPTVRVQSAAPRGKVWEGLSDKEKKLAYRLMQAANAGRDLLFYQTHRHSLKIKQLLEASLSADQLPETKTLLGEKPFNEYLVYAAKFLDQCGPYAGSNRKYILRQVTADQVGKLLTRHVPDLDAAARAEIARLLTDPTYEVQEYPEDPEGKGLEKTGSNYYQHGITGAEVRSVLDKSLKPTLNCRVARSDHGLTCQVMTTQSPGLVGERLRTVVAELEAARPYALTAHQKAEIDYLVAYFRGGDVEDFRKASIEWVRDRAASRVDFMLGWVEFEGDWLSRMASWESYVQIVDPEVSRLAEALARRAQSFEDAMPYSRFKKKFPADYSPPAIMVYYFQEIAALRSGGYNLPNFDDIRRDVGAKNVIRLPMPGEDEDPNLRAARLQALREFLPAAKVEPVMAHREKVWRNLVLMHEIIGHGSGTYDTTRYGATDDPVSVLGNLGGALEEQRADLTALVFAGDHRLVEIGACKDDAEAALFRRLTYDAYLGDFLQRLSRDQTVTEIHQRGHWLFLNKLLEAGAIGWVARDGGEKTLANQVLAVKDYDKVQQVAHDLLGELQAIKANRAEAKLKELFAKYAPLDAVHEPWAQAVIQRGKSLLVNAGYVEQPWRVTHDGKYESFGGQTLETIAPFWSLRR